ncbi:TrmB family transcriptional regulator [Haladaptatus sp. AB643]|nr:MULTISPECIES: TrmB family transcriptional regulator [unclassified Haladaptatus]MCO8244876.1 TrmB family transcriptional regulator [Haladaptatus sp. AB643]MCO8255611.1 TrmB family transcriptional regulator [Haladaptatus sp. AB618]
MEQTVSLQALQNAGFTQYEAEVYLEILKRGSASAIDLANASNVPKSRVYDVLRDLESDGHVEIYKQDNLRARVLDPDAVIADLRQRAESFADTADELDDLWDEPELTENDLTVVKRLETVIERARQYIRTAENEVRLAVLPEQFHELRPVLHEAHDRDIFIKLSLSPSMDGSLPPDDYLDFENTTSEVCYREFLTPFVVIVDHSRVCFAPQRGSGTEFGIIADNRQLTYVFHWYFQTTLWDSFETIYSVHDASPPLTYVNIRQCVADIAPLFHEGATIQLTARGYDRVTGEERHVSGRVTDLIFSGPTTDNTYPALCEVSGQVSIFVDDGETTHSIGGWLPQVEDIELERLTIESIEYTD